MTLDTAEHIDTLVIGAGQAGLATGKLLVERGRNVVILDALGRVGDNWRRHYDSLRLYSPACLDGLPGMDFPAPSHHFPTRDEVADYLEDYARHFALPVRNGVRVHEVAPDRDGYVVQTETGQIRAANVVVATGTFGRPHVPDFASNLDPTITQLHSSQYGNPTDLQPGPVVVVGAAHSGADIALEVARAGHATTLVGRDPGQVPVDIEGRLGPLLTRLERFVFTKVMTLRTPMGRKARERVRNHGGILLRVRRGDLRDAGVDWVTQRVDGIHAGRLLVLDDDSTIDAANVVWCTGYRQDFGWIDLPVFTDDGWPREHRGVVADAPGLYFVGLAFQYSFASMLLLGVGQDARHVVDHLLARQPTPSASPSPA
ncbi:MAG TPA: NAD(P)/FAD-dependent oxidoreductase [Nitriliruptoraceae bacterium]|nr:NAD(P)/FAD-dependent oxidoreductase [Nitriliruptoraceae bacterium]